MNCLPENNPFFKTSTAYKLPMKDDKVGEWDSRIPETPSDVVKLLLRRIEVHRWWRDYCLDGSSRAKSCEDYGVGTAESHQRYIDQYEAAITIMEMMA